MNTCMLYDQSYTTLHYYTTPGASDLRLDITECAQVLASKQTNLANKLAVMNAGHGDEEKELKEKRKNLLLLVERMG
jgi:hypothetical protein